MHISRFEKFCLKFQMPILLVCVFIIGVISGVFRNLNADIVIGVLLFVIGEVVAFTKTKIRKRADKFYSKNQNPNAAITLTNELLDIIGTKEPVEKIYIYFDLITYYIAIGEYEKVIDTCTIIRRNWAGKKIERTYDLSLRLFLSIAYLKRGEKDLYDKEIDYVREQMEKTKITKRVIAHQFTEVRLLEESLYGGNDPKFEEKVFDFLYGKRSNDKDKNPKPTNMQMISAYGLLFNYYKLNEDSEKATEYANKIIDMGNEQLAVYRNAKEYLDNAN